MSKNVKEVNSEKTMQYEEDIFAPVVPDEVAKKFIGIVRVPTTLLTHHYMSTR